MTPPKRLQWIKALRSMGANACVELARDGEMIALRDSKNPSVELWYTRVEIEAFLDGAKKGEFDHLLLASAGDLVRHWSGWPSEGSAGSSAENPVSSVSARTGQREGLESSSMQRS
jgi:hypothetical protein